ncbi:MAG TPA: hypothetical protein VKA48_09970 [Gammaproteobacteria bacterium]|nr:hypothetical protein [Gammaproteobacteria bacterium]
MAQFRLFEDSSTGVDVDPEWEYAEVNQKQESSHRTRSGRLYRYLWGTYRRWRVPVAFVDETFKSQVNSWWGGNEKLLWMEEGGTEVYSVQIVNAELPVGNPIRPYTDLFQGVIELETY